MGAIQVRAEILRDWPTARTMAGFVLPEGPSTTPLEARSGAWLQKDVKRAIAAAEKAGLRGYRIEIAPDGTISIVVEPAGAPVGGG